MSRGEAHVEDRLGLHLGELELLDQPGAGDVGVGGGADQLDHRVEVVERDQQALEDVGAGLGAAQLVLRPAGDDLALVARRSGRISSFSESVCGTPSTSATMLTPKVCCIGVCL